ncbi:MAG: hypothetical protein KKA73_18725 [Chloroflexi bacterium]|nr:hypothetical protein [Chloroflexota bacterium]MBU1749723.1 hypothetical protein [Chloroflexota bacterium]
MCDDEITLTRPPTITDEEARRRLGQAYRLLLDLARQKRAAEAEADNPESAPVDPAMAPETEAQPGE